jgi:enoyl-CoA hydratase/carnithine racemase
LDLLLTGERIDAEEAYRIGLVTRLSDSAQTVLTDALRVAELIATRPPTAIAYVKEAARAGLEADLAIGLKLEKALFALLTSTADRLEAAAAFREKRQGQFNGL